MDVKKREFLRALAVVGKGVAGLLMWNALGIGLSVDVFLRGATAGQAATVCAIFVGIATSFGMTIVGSRNPLDLGRGAYDWFLGKKHDNNIKTK